MSMWVSDIQRAKTPMRFLLATSRPYLMFAVWATFASATASFIETFSSYIFKKIVDSIALGPEAGISHAWWWVSIYLIFFLLLPLFLWRFSGFMGMRWAVGIRASATYALTAYVTKHSSDYFQKRFAGAIGGKVGNTAAALKTLIEKYLWSYLIVFVTLITTVLLAFNANTLIGWLFLSWLAIGGPLNFFMARKRVPMSATAQREDTRVRAQVIDLLTNVSAMHDFARRAFELKGMKETIFTRYQAGIRNWTWGELARVASNVLQVIFVGGIVLTAVHAWSIGSITPGDIVLILTLVGGLGYRMEELGRDINDFAEHYGEVREGLEDILDPYDIEDIKGAKSLALEEGTIDFKDVSFIYGEGNKAVLDSLSLFIPAGQKVGLVGKSGAGKSTLVKLLMRHYDLQSGEVTIDGQNIASVSQESLREAISVVPQEPLLFHRTIRENITYGKLDASDAEIRRAAELAQAHEFIKHLPHGYDTLVGERGVKLSGGERQRITLARALLKNSKVLLLDEATSSLDSESESAIQEALHVLMENKTVIAIAHRLSTLREMDRIIVLEEGQIIEDGSHDELLKKGGVYADFWSHQSGGYLQDE
ncbi:ABC transporter ATP-binding protein [Acetobacteraceae bacterium]|nr:ABC transporter ATP-binding protein [Candidatus Parcubacteria bacterium]